MATSKRSQRRRALASLKAQHQRRMTWLKRAAAVAVVALGAFLIYQALSDYSLDEIVESVKAIPLRFCCARRRFRGGKLFRPELVHWLAVRYAASRCPPPMRAVLLRALARPQYRFRRAVERRDTLRFYSRRASPRRSPKWSSSAA